MNTGLENCWRILKWNGLFSEELGGMEPDGVANRCHKAWEQLAIVLKDADEYGNSFSIPFIKYHQNVPLAHALYRDDEWLIFFMTDLRDYVSMIRQRNQAERQLQVYQQLCSVAPFA